MEGAAAVAPAAAAAAAAAAGPARMVAVWEVPVSVAAGAPIAPRAAAMNSRQVAYRSAGSLASALPMTSSISRGSVGCSVLGVVGISSTCAQMTAASTSLANGTRPVRHAYITQPSE